MKSRVIRAENANNASPWLLYVLIGVVLVIGIVVWAVYSPAKYDHRYDRWAQLSILTTMEFGYLLKWGWQYKGRARFWGVYLIALLAHSALLVTVFSDRNWHILALGIAGSFEFIAFATLMALAMGEKL